MLRVGYRSIDTAQCYGNEHEVGLACRKSGIARNELIASYRYFHFFALEADEMWQIEQLEIGKSLFGWW